MKPNPLLERLKEQYNAEFQRKTDILLQIGLDAAMIAAHEVFKLGPGRAEKFRNEYVDTVNEIAKLLSDDGKDDRDLVYAKTVVDRRLHDIVGDKLFDDWDTRYGAQIAHGQAFRRAKYGKDKQ